MKLKLENYWRISISLALLFSVMCGFGQSVNETKPIQFWNFDRNLIPAQTIYGMSWDSAHVDSPKFDRERVSWGFLLDLVEEECAYFHPFEGVITSRYGWRRGRLHKGIDIDLEIGDPIYAAFDGVVRIQKYNLGGFGNYVMIRHYNGLETLYAHLSESIVQRNQTVRAGQIIGFGGSTGRSSGSHLHFETRFLGQPINPEKLIDFKTFTLKKEQVFVNHTWFPAPSKPKPVATRKTYHKIRSGDTLYGLALRYKVSVNQICRFNGISRNTTLRIGRTLRIR